MNSPPTPDPVPALPDAVIFDMDGVLVDSNPFHITNWSGYLRKHGAAFDPELLPEQILGQRNDDALRSFFGPDLTPEQSQRMGEEIEANFREIFRPHAKPLPGLMPLMEECRRAAVPMAVASSAMRKNVDLVVETLRLEPYFKVVIDGDQVSRPKPDPEIYLLAARRLGAEPSRAVAFEDSFVGIKAVHRAGMKCVAIASTFPLEQLRDETEADWVVRSFEEVSLDRLRLLFQTQGQLLWPPGSRQLIVHSRK
ncbi:MAG TPA: HAD family phosphatase [Terriglobia bacterium]|nr:HAD family phosphatase [Terriglobia bacterium]